MNVIDNEPDVAISAGMLSAGEAELRDQRFGADLKEAVAAVYFAMEYQRREESKNARASSNMDDR